MAELINLRNARKRAKRRADEARADANRCLHGQSKHARNLADAERAKADRDLEGHRIEPGDGR
jgi:F0F1-type ATP synthase membrane subunit b/b'